MTLRQRQGSAAPSTKVQVGAAMGAVTIIAQFVAKKYGIDIDGITGSAITMVLTFLAQYFTPPTEAPRDQVIPDPVTELGD